MHEWSMDVRDVSLWANRLRERFGEDLQLVIIDHTGFEIPWELLVLPPLTSESDPTHLGLAVPTSHWQWVVDNVTLSDRLLEFDEAEYAGRVVGFVDSTVFSDGGKERKLLEEIGADIEQSLTALESRLTQPEAE
jgi:hypothetical protein